MAVFFIILFLKWLFLCHFACKDILPVLHIHYREVKF